MNLLPADLKALATGVAYPAALVTLKASQFRKHALLLRAIMDAARRDFPDEYVTSGYETSYDLLASVQATDTAQVAFVLAHPQVGSWAHSCFRLLLEAAADREQVHTELGQLGCVAAAAAIRASLRFEVTVPVQQGAVLLPTLGQAVFGTDGVAAIRHDERGLALTSGPTTVVPPADHRQDGPGWLGLRKITAESAGIRLELDVDDLGPHRACGPQPVSPRLFKDAFEYWREQVRGAWPLLVSVDPDRAACVSQVLASLVPQAEGYSENSTSRDAYGAVQLTEPNYSAYLAETLVHESQHSMLNAVLDLCSLYEDGGGLYYSPARDDPRPIHGLLHATYAFFGIADFWRRHRHACDDRSQEYAHFQFASGRAQVLCSTGSLLESGSLTAEGEAFVAGMRATAQEWAAEEVADLPVAWAEAAALDHRIVWRLNNLRNDPCDVAMLAKAWINSEPVPLPISDLKPDVEPLAGTIPKHIRTRLRYLRLLSPESFERVCSGLEPVPDTTVGVGTADLAYLSGDHTTAACLYAKHIAGGADEAADWAGLALALRECGEDADLLVTEPQLVRAVYNAVSDLQGQRPNPRPLAHWLRSEVDDVP
ncbi:HEXXH motif domain-containing protein [Streptomyces sp. NPDC001820]|uniref:HEXXH motif domain-containing protein n=1 Tax=Streptomyces sp. NPDC001820 TaxID=3364613 RepID=UPI0036BA9C91